MNDPSRETVAIFLQDHPDAVAGIKIHASKRCGLFRQPHRLVGGVSKYGVKLHTSPSGTPHATFHLVVTEQTADGKYLSTLIPCEVWGKKAPAAAAIASNTTVLFEGKISRRKRDETWELCVSGFELTPLTPTPQEVSA